MDTRQCLFYRIVLNVFACSSETHWRDWFCSIDSKWFEKKYFLPWENDVMSNTSRDNLFDLFFPWFAQFLFDTFYCCSCWWCCCCCCGFVVNVFDIVVDNIDVVIIVVDVVDFAVVGSDVNTVAEFSVVVSVVKAAVVAAATISFAVLLLLILLLLLKLLVLFLLLQLLLLQSLLKL